MPWNRMDAPFFTTKGRVSKAVFFLGLALFLTVHFSLLRDTGQDQGMYLRAGELILEGKRPFVDFFDINPPWIMYFSSAFVFFARMLSVPPIVFFNLLTLVWFASLATASAFLLNSFQGRKQETVFYGGAILFLSLAYHDVLHVYGQRDHILTIALLAYLCLKAARLSGKNVRVPGSLALFIGGSFGLAVAFKPHFLLYWIGTELFVMRSSDRRKSLLAPESLVTAFFQIAVYGHLALMAEPAWSNFWSTHLPAVLKYYGVYRVDFLREELFSHAYPFDLGLGSILLLTALANWRRLSTFSKLIFLNLLFAFAVLFAQNKYFIYHFSTAELLQFIGAAELLGLFVGAPASRRRVAAVVTSALVIVCQTAFAMGSIGLNFRDRFIVRRNEPYASITEAIQSRLAKPGDSILVLSPLPVITYPAANRSGCRIASRYLFQYPLSFLAWKRWRDHQLFFDPNDRETEAYEAKWVEQIREDVALYKPQLIYFPEHTTIKGDHLPLGFPTGEYLKKIGLNDLFEKNYQIVRQAPYIVYVKRPS